MPGKIAIESMDHVCRIYENSDTVHSAFEIRDDRDVHYGDFSWLNTKDSLVGSEFFSGSAEGDKKANIAMFDIKGNILERMYESEKGVIAGLPFSSRNDRRLLFVIEKAGDSKKNPLEGLMRMNSIAVMDLQKKQVINMFENVGIMPSFEIDESPWLFDETRFVYSYTRPEGKENDKTYDSSGVYICDIGKDQKRLLIPDGHYAICSPTSLDIAFIRGRSIWVMDLQTNKETMIYQGGRNERFRNMHWTPDGQSIYLAYFDDYIFSFFTSGEKLIETSTKKDIPFKKIELGFKLYSYTWK